MSDDLKSTLNATRDDLLTLRDQRGQDRQALSSFFRSPTERPSSPLPTPADAPG